MRILTPGATVPILSGQTPDSVIRQLSKRLKIVRGTYSAPVNAGKQTALSRYLASILLRECSALLYITGWNIVPAAENLDLFYGYRHSAGETRLLIDAPVHMFDETEHDALLSILSMVCYFFWDASVFDLAGKTMVQVSHDGWLEIRSSDDVAMKDIASELERYTTLRAAG